MIYFRRHSAFQFTNRTDIEFSPVEYSKFKFGSKSMARKFGTQLAQSFIKHQLYATIVKKTFENSKVKIVVMSSPYTHTVTATFAMKDYFIRELNNQLVEDGYDPVIEAKIYRQASYKEDYGSMSAAERKTVMDGDSFHVDKTILEDNICIFLDDIIITGSHEYGIKRMLEKLEIKTAANLFLYFAQLTGNEAEPQIENYLNYAYVTDLIRLDHVIKNGEFLMNTRTVKYILNAPHEECRVFLQFQKSLFLATLYHNAIGNGYHKIPDYQANLKYLKSML